MISRLFRNSALVSGPAAVAMVLALMASPAQQHAGRTIDNGGNQTPSVSVTKVAYAHGLTKIQHIPT